METAQAPQSPANGALVVERRFAELFAASGLRTLEDLFDQDLGQALGKPGLERWRERVRFSLTTSPHGLENGVAEGTGVFYAKRYHAPPAKTRREMARSGSGARSLAGVEWFWLHRFKQSGIPCAEPVAFGEEMRGAREVRSVVVTQEVPGTSLETWCDERLKREPEAVAQRGLKPAARGMVLENPSVREIAHHVARVIARLHGASLFHRDLYLCHIFCDGSAPLAESVRLIDLQRVLAPAWGRSRWRVKDLAALNYSTPSGLFSRSDRIRWLKRYLGVSELDSDSRRLIYRIMGKTCAIARHDRKRLAVVNAGGAFS